MFLKGLGTRVMSEDVDRREHSEHSPRLRVDAALKAIAFPKRTTETDRNLRQMSRVY